ncbi:MAG: orotate phosphoribosyltransferase [Candidatus Asgardarchaeia archaeon]
MTYHRTSDLISKLSERLFRIGALKFGDFILSSGKHSPYYLDLRILPSFPKFFDEVTDAYIEVIKKEVEEFDKIGGVLTAGVPIATLVSFKMKVPMVYVRSKEKGYGRKRRVEGIIEEGDRILIIDDLITTGGNLIEAANSIRDEGAIVMDAVVLIDREQGGLENLKENGIKLHYLMKVSQMMDSLKEKGLISDKEYEEVMEYIRRERT